MVSGRTVKLKSVNCMEIYYAITMTLSMKLGFVKLKSINFYLEANRKILLP